MAIKDYSSKVCPFNKDLACGDCRFWRIGVKLVGVEKRREDVADCIFHLLIDNVEMEHVALRSVQSLMHQTKDASLFQALALLAESAHAKAELKRIIARNIDGLEQFLGVTERKKTDLQNLLEMIDEESKDATRKITN
jgi:hypothetical protein